MRLAEAAPYLQLNDVFFLDEQVLVVDHEDGAAGPSIIRKEAQLFQRDVIDHAHL